VTRLGRAECGTAGILAAFRRTKATTTFFHVPAASAAELRFHDSFLPVMPGLDVALQRYPPGLGDGYPIVETKDDRVGVPRDYGLGRGRMGQKPACKKFSEYRCLPVRVIRLLK
jgi:hypothetical protein